MSQYNQTRDSHDEAMSKLSIWRYEITCFEENANFKKGTLQGGRQQREVQI